jgi:hypothetical protein
MSPSQHGPIHDLSGSGTGHHETSDFTNAHNPKIIHKTPGFVNSAMGKVENPAFTDASSLDQPKLVSSHMQSRQAEISH